jgi:hypothetical protein
MKYNLPFAVLITLVLTSFSSSSPLPIANPAPAPVPSPYGGTNMPPGMRATTSVPHQVIKVPIYRHPEPSQAHSSGVREFFDDFYSAFDYESEWRQGQVLKNKFGVEEHKPFLPPREKMAAKISKAALSVLFPHF